MYKKRPSITRGAYEIVIDNILLVGFLYDSDTKYMYLGRNSFKP